MNHFVRGLFPNNNEQFQQKILILCRVLLPLLKEIVRLLGLLFMVGVRHKETTDCTYCH